MFEAEQTHIGEQIKAYCAQQDLPEPKLVWSWIPFNGQWGISTSFFHLASLEARQGKKVIVPQPIPRTARRVRANRGGARISEPVLLDFPILPTGGSRGACQGQ